MHHSDDDIAGAELDKTDEEFSIYDQNYKSIFPYNLYFQKTAERPADVAGMLKKFYFPCGKIDRQHFMNLADLFSDALSYYPLVQTARTNKGVSFFYLLNYRGANTIASYYGSEKYLGVAHSDELFYLYPLGGPRVRNITECDTALSKQLVKMWANFVTYLDPTPNGTPIKWFPVYSLSIQFLNICQCEFKMENQFYKQRMDFWDHLPFRNKQQTGNHQGMFTEQVVYIANCKINHLGHSGTQTTSLLL